MATRKAMREQAAHVVKDILRMWMQQHAGEQVPEEVFRLCEQAVRSLNNGSFGPDSAAFVHWVHVELLRTEGPPQKHRSEDEWRALFPRYPSSSTDDGYLLCFEPSNVDGIREALQKFGLCVVRVLTASQCEETVIGMFEEVNALRAYYGVVGPPVDPHNAATWQSENWPSKNRYLVKDRALHKQAFANRCNGCIYEVFAAIFRERRLHVSVDNWGIARGARDNPDWAVALRPHWDVSPWRFVEDVQQGLDPGYQGLVALTDQNLETGCHLTLPGCTHFMEQWCAERRQDWVGANQSFKAAEDDPVVPYMQPVPLRRGEMVIWSCGQLHASIGSSSQDMRLVQYIRMYPAPEAGCKVNYEGRDPHGCVRALKRCFETGELTQAAIDSFGLDALGKRLLALESWDAEASTAVLA
ncbi:unnamed protein product [Polarella glacialis]|uniref:Phytanoyl-CoA dioxygenase n=3 Tax=Polarella glacialis TaxID=89957 RepID=A0A813GG58_POLGL|nr:unnamed protein product [Polarella glacialis]